MFYCERTGWWMPDGETHLIDWMLQVGERVDERLTYQRHKYLAALPFAKGRRVAVDIGAHVGLWSWQMARDFAQVVAFEPMPDHQECWRRNVTGKGLGDDQLLVPVALGERPGEAALRTRTEGSSGDTGVDPDGEGIKVKLDVLDRYELDMVDLVKIDCEGYEIFVLKGAVETLKRCRPVVVVEQKPETGMEARYGIGTTDAVAFLEDLGAKRRAGIQGDYILSWD